MNLRATRHMGRLTLIRNPAPIVAAAAIIASCVSAPVPSPSPVPGIGQHAAITAPVALTTAVTCPPGFPSIEETLAWRSRVYAARALPAGEQGAAMTALVRNALEASGIKVNVAANSSPDQVSIADLKPTPMVNFDIHLNEKVSAQLSPNTVPRSLGDNGGYYFTKDKVPYIVIGPKAVDARSPVFIREYAEHEMFHADHHVGDARPQSERELEDWSHGFTNYFHLLYPYRMQWGPMLDYYDQSSEAARLVAFGKLLGYYNNPPAALVPAACVDEIKAEFRGWIVQRLGDSRTSASHLVRDLQAKIGIAVADAPLPGGTSAAAAASIAQKNQHVTYWVAAGDLNNDKRAEVLRWNSADKDLVIYDYSSGHPKELTSHPFPNSPGAVRIADIDGDGSNELIVAEGLPGYNSSDGEQTDVRLNIYNPLEPNGWTPVELYRAVSERPEITGLDVVDFDGDKQRDIVLSYFSSKYGVTFVVARRTGADWKVDKLSDIRMGNSMGVGDILESGKNLLVVGRPYSEPTPADIAKRRPTIGDAFVIENEKRIPLPVFRGVSAVAIGDVNGDRRPDIVVNDGWHSDYGKIARGRLAVVRRVGAKWAYEFIDDVPSEMRLSNIVLADLDRDGWDEIVVAGEARKPFQRSAVRIYKHAAGGWRRTTVADSTDGFAVGDFFGDGKKELVFAGLDTGIYKPDLARVAWTKPDPEVQTYLNNPADVIGNVAPELKVEEWVGDRVRLASLKGKVILLDYWATWCAPCIAAFPELKRLLREYGPAGFAIVGMTNHSEQTPADVRKMVALKKLTWPTGIDSKSRSHMDYGVQNLPHQILIDQKGVIHSYYVGGGETIGLLESDIRKLLGFPELASVTVAKPSTPAPSLPAAGETVAVAAGSNCPAGFPSPTDLSKWKSRVDAARAMTNLDTQRDSMLALVREALGPETVVLSARNSVPNQPHAADYSPYPVVNFDARLGDKRNSNTSYSFTAGGQAYVVVGPGSLNPAGPARVVQNAQHELYHAAHHMGDPRPVMDREAEVWGHLFVSQFHKIYPYEMIWGPLVSSYELASPAERQIVRYMMLNYYKTPPASVAPECVAEFRAAYLEWLERRTKDSTTTSKQLIRDLQEGLNHGGLPAPVVKPLSGS